MAAITEHTSLVAANDAEALAALGWDPTFADAFAPFAAAGLMAARVVAEHRDRYVLAGALDEDVAAVLAGRLRHDARSRLELPAVGDWVAATRVTSASDLASIHAVLPGAARSPKAPATRRGAGGRGHVAS